LDERLMVCRPLVVDGKVVGIACGGRSRATPCKAANCGVRSSKLCDWRLHQVMDGKKVYTGKTCDMALCAQHAHAVGKDKDLCPAHFAAAKAAGWVK
jgi:hypothetical protein